MGDFLMPRSLGADMEAGTIVEWRVHPGDVVHRGDVVAVVDTDKSDIEVEVFEDGVVEEPAVDEGRSVAVGTLARIGGPTDDRATTSRRRPDMSGPPHWLAVERPRPGWTPCCRRQRPGPGRRGATWPRPSRPGSGRRCRSAGKRDGGRSERSWPGRREIPHYYLASTVDLGPATAWLAERNASRPVAQRLLPAVLFVKATAWPPGRSRRSTASGPMVSSPPLRCTSGWRSPARQGTRRSRHGADRLDLDELDGPPALPGRASSREAAQLGDERPDDHRDEPGRGGC